MNKPFKILLFSLGQALGQTLVLALVLGLALILGPAGRDLAQAAAYTAPPAQSPPSGQPERAPRAGRPLTDSARSAGPAATVVRVTSSSAGQITPVYLENIGTDQGSPADLTDANGVRLVEHAFFLLDPSSSLSIEQAGSPARQGSYSRLADGIPLNSSGVFWLRFSLANSDPSRLQPASGPVLRLEPGTPPARMYVAQEFAKNGDVRRWREIVSSPEGVFHLPDPRGLPLTVYMKFDGVPGLWFNPQLTSGGAETQSLQRYLPLAVQIVLGLAILVLLLRGLAGREEWRLWGAALLGCALVQALFSRQSPELGSVYLTSLPPLLAPGLLVTLMPHLGRHLLQSRERPLLDFLLIILSLPGAAAALLPLVPGLGWTAKFLPLAPLLLLPLLCVAGAAMSRRRPGAATYFLICLLPLLGALLALLGLCLAEVQFNYHNLLYRLGPNLTYYGYAAAALVMIFSGRGRAESREDFFPLEISAVNAFNAGGDPDLKLYPADYLPDSTADPSAEAATAPANQTDLGFRLVLAPDEPSAAGPEPEALPEYSAPPLASRPPDNVSSGNALPGDVSPDDISPEGFSPDDVFLDEHGEPVLRVVRLYTPEPPATAEPEIPEPAEAPLPAAQAVAAAERPEAVEEMAGDLPEPLSDPLSSDESAGPAQEAWAEGASQMAPDAGPLEAPVEVAAGLEPADPSPSPPSPTDRPSQAAPPVSTQRIDPAEPGGPAASAAFPNRVVEDPSGEIAPFNLTEVVWYKDQEEPGLVIIKPMSPAYLAEPPFPLSDQAEPPFTQADQAEPSIMQADQAQPSLMQAALPEQDDPLELIELARPATPPEQAEPAAAEDQPEAPPLAEQYAVAADPDSFLSGLAEILPEDVSPAPAEAPEPAEHSQDSLSGLDEALNCLDRLARAEAMNQADWRVFNLSSLLRQIHADTSELAESRGIALSWFVSPSLDLLYKGDEKTLRLTLSHMLRGAVESARDGAIQLAVRPAPEGEDLIRFSLTDSALTPDSPRPPARLLSRAWELACASQGSFSIEFVPERGTSINFSLRLKTLEDEDYIEAAQNGFPARRRPPTTRPQPRGLDEMTGLAENSAGSKDLDGPLDAALLDGVALSNPASRPFRDSIVIVDPADSGRRLIARRLGGLPYEKVEAASLREALQACSWGNVALLILDGELAADEVGRALAEIDAEEAAAGRPPLPSLCLLSHMSQSERLLKAGCTACQVKSENREEFQALVQRLIAEELRRPAPERLTASLAETGPSVSMLDMIVSSLDSESAALEKDGGPPPEPPAKRNRLATGQSEKTAAATAPGLGLGFESGPLTRLAGTSGEFMDTAMVPLIPGFLDVMRENLQVLEDGVAALKFAQVQEVTARIQSQSKTYGLSNLERMAACVERAAQAKDREAVSDLAEELVLMCRRYLNSLRETHQATLG